MQNQLMGAWVSIIYKSLVVDPNNFEKKISKLIFTNLPFVTVEQLKIYEIEKNINK